MSDKPSFFFDQFVPGFDFLKNLANSAGVANGSAASAAKAGLPGMPGIPGIPGMSSWIAPTLSVEEVDKRIQELKAVQFWLDQNLHALKATIQALEVQRMTLSTLQGMNLQMEDLAKAFAGAGPAKQSAAEAEPARAARDADASAGKPKADAKADAQAHAPGDGAKAAAGMVDPMQLWGALTQQFQQIAATALQDAANLKMPGMASAGASKASRPSSPAPAASKAKAPVGASARKSPARKRGSTARQR